MCKIYGYNKFRELQRRSGSKTFAPSKMKPFVTTSQGCILKCTFTDVAGLLVLPLYKCKTEEGLKVH